MANEDERPLAEESAESLRRLLADIDEGRVAADDIQRAYLTGSLDAFERIAGHCSPDAVHDTDV